MHHSSKVSHSKNSQKINNIFQPNIRVYQSPNQQGQNLIYNKVKNLNNENYNNNVRVNKIKPTPKGKIIEGDLNFPNNNIKKKNIINQNRIPNNAKQKKVRGKPTKSPIPIPKDYKYSNYQKLFINNHKSNNTTNNIIKPKSAVPRQNNFLNNDNNNNNKNIFKPNNNNNIGLGLSANLTSNKTYNTFNVFKKNLERKQSPLQRTSINSNQGFNYVIQKGQVKSRYVSKSPILSKGSMFNRYKMNIFGNVNNNSTNSNNKNIKRKTPIKNNNKKQINNNVNNIRTKGPTLIQGELIQDSSGGKFNINKKSINNNINHNEEYKNIKPVYNSQNLKIESNNALLNICAEVNNKENDKIIKKKEINDNNKENINRINNINGEQKKENKKVNQRSQSTGVVNPLQKETKEENIKEKEIKPEKPKYITKKIKDILPYTHVGFDGEEPKENNQDNYFIYKNFMEKKDYIYMSVCDGHGIEGHFVSDFIKEILPFDMSENLKTCNLMTENAKEKQKINQIIKETFILANEKLVENEEINSLFSGSTCVSVIYTPEKLIVPNIGDSRAVLGRLINKEKNEYKAIDLSRDHKPTEKDEAKRIIENDGRIQPFLEEGEFVGPQRVWIKEEEVPGLAMTRSFGDRVAATVGVMSEPEIKEFYFNEGDKFMIIASDGIWEFISSQECVDMIKTFYDKNDLKGCCEYLYQESSKRWLKEEEVIDDTTLILVFFE